MIQTRLIQQTKERFKYFKKQINYIYKDIQRFETSRGCPHLCPFCYEPNKLELFSIPEVTKNKVQILDMNFLWQPNIIERIRSLKKKGVTYEAVCGFDHRLLTEEIAKELKKSKFTKIRIAWDWTMNDQFKIKIAIDLLKNVGYRNKDISCFMLTNWKISRKECERKLDLLKIWNIKVCDCCYDGGYKNLAPNFWSLEDIKEFRSKCRKHNQLINFKIDPEL